VDGLTGRAGREGDDGRSSDGGGRHDGNDAGADGGTGGRGAAAPGGRSCGALLGGGRCQTASETCAAQMTLIVRTDPSFGVSRWYGKTEWW
jgi:hypothetical protein